MYGINEVLTGLIRNDYSEHLSEKEYEIDCSLGQNPFGAYPDLKLDEIDMESILSSYPHGEDELLGEIVNRFGKVADISKNNISLTCGSMGALIVLNRIFLKKDKKIVGVAPQFTAIIDDFKTYEADYDPVFLKKEKNFKFDLNDMIEKIYSTPEAYIYIDNPNNPTGQIIELKDIEKIVEKAKENNSFVCIDEAYGDYMDDRNSAISLLNKYDNLVVARTLSKGLGAAGIRLGYLVASEDFTKIIGKVNIPFSGTGISLEVARQVVNSGWEKTAISKSENIKPRVRELLKNIKVSYTSDSVPIALYYVEDKDINLEEKFIDGGMRVVTCDGYDGLGKNYVRINLHKDEDAFMRLIKRVDDSLS